MGVLTPILAGGEGSRLSILDENARLADGALRRQVPHQEEKIR